MAEFTYFPWEQVFVMVLIGAAILPHGSLILDPTLEDLPPGAEELHTAAKYVGDYVRDHEPDIIVIATPHGINLSDSIGIYASRVATGSAEWNHGWSDFKVSANINDEFATELYHHLQVPRSFLYCNTMTSPPCLAEEKDQFKSDCPLWSPGSAFGLERGRATVLLIRTAGNHGHP
jgi:hypothetical protein